MKPLYLKRGEDKRLRTGHLWIFSNEVDVNKSPLRDFEPGEPALVHFNEMLNNVTIETYARKLRQKERDWTGADDGTKQFR